MKRSVNLLAVNEFQPKGIKEIERISARITSALGLSQKAIGEEAGSSAPEAVAKIKLARDQGKTVAIYADPNGEPMWIRDLATGDPKLIKVRIEELEPMTKDELMAHLDQPSTQEDKSE